MGTCLFDCVVGAVLTYLVAHCHLARSPDPINHPFRSLVQILDNESVVRKGYQAIPGTGDLSSRFHHWARGTIDSIDRSVELLRESLFELVH